MDGTAKGFQRALTPRGRTVHRIIPGGAPGWCVTLCNPRSALDIRTLRPATLEPACQTCDKVLHKALRGPPVPITPRVEGKVPNKGLRPSGGKVHRILPNAHHAGRYNTACRAATHFDHSGILSTRNKVDCALCMRIEGTTPTVPTRARTTTNGKVHYIGRSRDPHRYVLLCDRSVYRKLKALLGTDHTVTCKTCIRLKGTAP